ncbi:MAG: DegT/DnrJ/EryC1/StrS family aminotransferase [Bacteroidales bacterium]|nr:DegT/DnrJ/EryC1/StrS family aminotransferase [Bacteroidales bacterium]
MINVTKTYLPKLQKYQQYVEEIFRSGWLTNNGQFVQELEKRLSQFLGVNNILLVSNGTLALQIAYRALKLEKKKNVITTPFTFIATSSSLLWESYNPIFVDIHPDTLNIDVKLIQEKIDKETCAILPVHVFGNACDITEIQAIAEDANIKVIYDAAHAFAINYKNKSILRYGDASILSFHSTKIFHTIEGGAIIFENEELFEEAKLLINFGIPGYDRISTLGINCKMNEFQAAMGLCVLDEFEIIKLGRNNAWINYYEAFKDNKDIKLQHWNFEATMNYSYFPIILNSERIALQIQKRLNNIDIYPRRYFYPSLDTLSFLGNSPRMSISNSVASRILCLPLAADINREAQSLIIDSVLNSCK